MGSYSEVTTNQLQNDFPNDRDVNVGLGKCVRTLVECLLKIPRERGGRGSFSPATSNRTSMLGMSVGVGESKSSTR